MTKLVVRSSSGLLPLLDVSAMEEWFDDGPLERGEGYAVAGRVQSIVWNEEQSVLIGRVAGSGGKTYSVLAHFMLDVSRTAGADGTVAPDEPAYLYEGSICTCPVGEACKHAVAMLCIVEQLDMPGSPPPEADLGASDALGRLLAADSRTHGRQAAAAQGDAVHASHGGTDGTSGCGGAGADEPEAGWKAVLRTFTGGSRSAAAQRGDGGRQGADGTQVRRLGIQFSLMVQKRAHYGYPIWDIADEVPHGVEWTPVMRVVEEGARPGTWRRGNLSWSSFAAPGFLPYAAHQSALMAQLYRLSGSERLPSQVYGGSEDIRLDSFTGGLVWEVLQRLREAGVAFLAGSALGAVKLGREAELAADLTDEGEGGLRLTGGVRVDEAPVEGARPVGENGIAALVTPDDDGHHEAQSLLEPLPQSPRTRGRRPDRDRPTLLLAPSAHPLDAAARQALAAPLQLLVPREDAPEFLTEYVPRLLRTLRLDSPDGSVEVPAPRPPRLRLRVVHGQGDAVVLHWSWDVVEFDEDVPVVPAPALPRHPELERTVLEDVRSAWPGAATSPVHSLHGVPAARFCTEALPRIEELDGVRVEVSGQVRDFRKLEGEAAIDLQVNQAEQPDWFSLDFQVAVAGQRIPFKELFAALAVGEEWLLLPDGNLLALATPEFEELRVLIREGLAVADWEAGGQQVSKMQLGMLSDLAELADTVKAPPEWQAGVDRLRALDSFTPPPVPEGFRAELRDYQQEGYAWLSMLHATGLGGILADDMGLGKTVQTLALIAHARQQDPQAPPFLVIAPSSVVGVWVQEAQRFAPDLDVRALRTAPGRKDAPSWGECRQADIVVTSYAIARMNSEEFQAAEWDGLIMDEAQFVKNPVSKGNRAIAKMRAPFRLAITGTPVENSLRDLWALLSLTAGGLFPSPTSFSERFVAAIEKNAEGPDVAAERLGLLRRRLRPFMLRRTKDQVASALPPKQDQVARIPLTGAHRKLYDAVLQKERLKVMGMLDEGIEGNRFAVLRSLTLLRMLALEPSLVDEAHAHVRGSKLTALMENLGPVLEGGSKVLVFSQFTTFLTRVGVQLEARGVSSVQLDGSTRDRDAVIREFREGEAQVFLISLKAGGFGLTLTEADYVFLLDPWWNPAAEAQAVDRVHRIGQTKRVMVYRMVAEDTIEEKVLALQERKAQLFSSLVGEGEDLAFSDALSAADVHELLSGE
ncbi:DEAD/DEAH box helicase [Brevibacterium salitolerans]|uniref:DEAD/DEAH box helicase n=2 Tax=Brevibacterium TaxID=1696 RepID=A0ABP5I736_9MICO